MDTEAVVKKPTAIVFGCKVTLCFNDGLEDPYVIWIENDNAKKEHLIGLPRKTLKETIGVFLRDFPSIISEELKLRKLPDNFSL